eukprot:scaffold7790_cov229-Pinguiococcus_pyrenoidosus.AAC.2
MAAPRRPARSVKARALPTPAPPDPAFPASRNDEPLTYVEVAAEGHHQLAQKGGEDPHLDSHHPRHRERLPVQRKEAGAERDRQHELPPHKGGDSRTFPDFLPWLPVAGAPARPPAQRRRAPDHGGGRRDQNIVAVLAEMPSKARRGAPLADHPGFKMLQEASHMGETTYLRVLIGRRGGERGARPATTPWPWRSGG